MQLLHYQTYGEKQDLALLLVHPLGTDLRFWEECVSTWRSRFYCIAPDLQACGKSPIFHAPRRIHEHTADLERLRESLEVAAVVPVGCALGSMVAAAYAARYPVRSRALVMANPGVRNSDAANDMLRKRVDALHSGGVAALLPAAAERAFLNLAHDERYERHVQRFAAQDSQRLAHSILGFIDADITAELPRITCPTLVVSGEHDVLMPADSAQRIKQMVPHAQCAVMTGVAHFLPFQAPDRFAAMVADFLQAVAIRSDNDRDLRAR